MPILGYSLKSSFDPDAMGEATKALLGEYARDIEMIRYDSRVPEEAIAAWTDYRAYVASMLSARYDATDPAFSMADAGERVRNIETSGRMEDFSSDIFTPEQWREEINAELRANKSVALGIFGGKGVEAAIIHGRKGDYYRMELDSRNDWLMRLMATEYLSEGQIADRGEVAEIVDEDEEERPFSLYEDFLAGVAREEDERRRMLDERLIPTEPAVRVIGEAILRFSSPERVELARVYNLGGSMVRRQTFKNTDTAVISLEGNPYGFYFVLLNGESGKPYGVKLYR